jgi:predicted nucleotidyltransferase
MTDFEVLLKALSKHQVAFIVVGGAAAIAHGSARLTQDLDIVYSRSPENLEGLSQALAEFKPYLRGVPRGLPFTWDKSTLARGLNFTLVTTVGDLDLLGEIPGGGTYDDLVRDAAQLTIFGMAVRCLSLNQLVRAKRAAGRPKDLEALAELESIRDNSNFT